MNLIQKSGILVLISGVFITNSMYGQVATHHNLHLTTGVGVNKILGAPGNTFRSSVAFNSGFEIKIFRHSFAQLEANFNTLKYDQQEKDDNSSYLFINTNSSLFMLGINGGRDFNFKNPRWFTSLYLGTGYINLGEPRLRIDELNNIAEQYVVRKGGVFGRGGGRIGFITQSTILQTLYFDVSGWTSSVKTESGNIRSFSVFLGMRMAMD